MSGKKTKIIEKIGEKIDEKMNPKIEEKINNSIDKKSSSSSYTSTSSEGLSSTFREIFNYYLSFFYENDIQLIDIVEPKNACCFYRLFGNHPKIYKLLPELRIQYNFLFFLIQHNMNENDKMLMKVTTKIFQYLNNVCINFDDIDDIDDKNKADDNIENKKFKHRKITEGEMLVSFIQKSSASFKNKIFSYMELSKEKEKNNFFKEVNTENISPLMLLQLLFIIEKFPNFIYLFIKNFLHEEKEALLFFSFYLTWIGLQVLKQGRLNLYFNKQKNIFDTFNEFYLGLFDYSFILLDSYKTNNYYVFSKIEREARDFPSSIFWRVKSFKQRYPEIKSETSLTSFFNNLSNEQ